MYYNVLELKELPDKKIEGFVMKTLLEHDNSSLTVVSLKKDEIVDDHISVCDACVIVYEGEVELHFAAEKFTVKKGELIMFKKEQEHKVLALKDSKFLLIKI
ncbi:MAG: cupin domain-containing protein [Candidatus Gastranaerophilales bacterium]|nr:cupin domain-containing protein [Candidatus Gastranaerophilales bacterium]MCM1073436.1 cupin domain-containing protein [Bacteroides sp.]